MRRGKNLNDANFEILRRKNAPQDDILKGANKYLIFLSARCL